jgi:hypothetical protein
MIFLHVPVLCTAASFRLFAPKKVGASASQILNVCLVANSALELVDTVDLPDELSPWHASE